MFTNSPQSVLSPTANRVRGALKPTANRLHNFYMTKNTLCTLVFACFLAKSSRADSVTSNCNKQAAMLQPSFLARTRGYKSEAPDCNMKAGILQSNFLNRKRARQFGSARLQHEGGNVAIWLSGQKASAPYRDRQIAI